MSNNVLLFKNSLPNLTIIQINSQDIELIKSALRNKLKKAPMMFIGMQVVLYFSNVKDKDLRFCIKDLRDLLYKEGLILIAIMTDNKSIWKQSIKHSVGVIPVIKKLNENEQLNNSVKEKIKNKNGSLLEGKEGINKEELQKNNIAEVINIDNKIITNPVRSGQRIYSHADLIIVGTVSVGAEVIADGNIHIYGSLRGRAIAGAKGDCSARIFCKRLEAELISIAGNYKTNEDINDEFYNRNVQISLEDKKICFLSL